MNSLILALKALVLSIPLLLKALAVYVFTNFTLTQTFIFFVVSVAVQYFTKDSINWDLVFILTATPLLISLVGGLLAHGAVTAVKGNVSVKRTTKEANGVQVLHGDDLPDELKAALLKSIKDKLKE